MRIIVILQNNPFVKSSAQNNRFLSISEGLIDNGANLKLLFVEGYRSNKEKAIFSKVGKFKRFEYEYINFINYKYVLLRKVFNLINSPQKNSNRISAILKKDEKYDYLWLGISSMIVNISKVLLKNDLSIKIFHERSEYSWIGLNNAELHKEYLNNILPKINIFAVMTKALEVYYKPFLNKGTQIIHLPMTVDFTRFSDPIKKLNIEKTYIAYCGTMNNRKDGVDILIKAFVGIMNEYPQIYLYLAGPKIPQEDYLRQKEIISIHHATNKIIYLGNLSREDIPSFLLNAQILVLSRPNSKQAEGGFPTKLGEYLATGKPVCVTDVGEIQQYLSDKKSAFFAKPGCVESFANAMRMALSSPASESIGSEGKKVAQKYFNKDIQSKNLYTFLELNRKNT